MDKTGFSAAFPAFAVDGRVLSFDYTNDAIRSTYKLPARELAKTVNVGDRYQLQIVQVTNPHSFHFWIYDNDYDSYAIMS